MKKVYLFGSSGHALVVRDALESMHIDVAGYFDHTSAESLLTGLTCFGSESRQDIRLTVKDQYVFPAIGSNAARQRVVALAEGLMLNQLIATHSRAIVSERSQIGLSSLVGAGSIVNPLTSIGKGCIINTGAIIEHECVIGDFVHIAPGAVLAGNVCVGKHSFIGANAVVKQGVVIGENVIVGAGSVVLSDIPSNETHAGNPARKIEKYES
jgi:sugar O-acyltransferase (sialic acid O-acetyltransferase NeuD family)